MKTRGRRRLAAVAALFGSACLIASSGLARDLEPLSTGWERVFAVTWQSTDARGTPAVFGRVNNTSPYHVRDIRVLVDGLDGGGAVVDQRLAWVPGDLLGGSSVYFEVPVSQASAYRVRVFSYTRVETGGSFQ